MLRQKFPEMPIGLLCQKPFGQIVPPELRVKIFHLPPHAGFFATLKVLKAIRKQHYSHLFDLFANPRTAVISLLSGIKNRYGFDYRYRRHAYTKTYHPPDANLHLMKLFADFFAEFGFAGQVTHPQLVASPAASKKVAAFSAKLLRPLLGINPHTTYPSKAWPEEYFVEFINLWFDKFQTPVLVTWGPGERDAAADIIAKAGSEKAVLQPEVSIMEFAALLSELDLFLTGDTGPMNIAWACNTPTVALFGPTTRKAVAPEGDRHLVLFTPELDCLECHQEQCSHKSCMTSMKPAWVFDQVVRHYSLRLRKTVK
jgi:heptosyltransferase-2